LLRALDDWLAVCHVEKLWLLIERLMWNYGGVVAGMAALDACSQMIYAPHVNVIVPCGIGESCPCHPSCVDTENKKRGSHHLPLLNLFLTDPKIADLLRESRLEMQHMRYEPYTMFVLRGVA
jgi:hypothetical protein